MMLKYVFQLVFFTWIQNHRCRAPGHDSVPHSCKEVREAGLKEVGILKWVSHTIKTHKHTYTHKYMIYVYICLTLQTPPPDRIAALQTLL
jgi:hypothetical protein